MACHCAKFYVTDMETYNPQSYFCKYQQMTLQMNIMSIEAFLYLFEVRLISTHSFCFYGEKYQYKNLSGSMTQYSAFNPCHNE